MPTGGVDGFAVVLGVADVDVSCCAVVAHGDAGQSGPALFGAAGQTLPQAGFGRVRSGLGTATSPMPKPVWKRSNTPTTFLARPFNWRYTKHDLDQPLRRLAAHNTGPLPTAA
jgi:hypothetical protein